MLRLLPAALFAVLLPCVQRTGGAAPAPETPQGLIASWERAAPGERRRLRDRLARIEEARRFVDARPVLVPFEGRPVPLADLFRDVLARALATPTEQADADPLGLAAPHRRALAALEALREAHAPPRPLHAGTLNLLLAFAHDAITAPALSPGARLRFLTEALRNVRAMEGRVEPDLRTAWLLHHRLLPALLGFDRRHGRDATMTEAIGEAAALLYLPSLLDLRAQERLAPLTGGVHARDILLRTYAEGALDAQGVVALARSVAARTRDEAAFAAGAAPLLLELLCDATVPARERGMLADAVLLRLGEVGPLEETARDLLSVAFGGSPQTLQAYRDLRPEERAPLPRPAPGRTVRFLCVLARLSDGGRPPAIARVLRADARLLDPIHAREPGGGRVFVGVLVPSVDGEGVDFLGPPPSLAGGRDNRLTRRPLRLERVAVSRFGTRGEIVELCAALPEDASEPVPEHGATFGHLLALIEERGLREEAGGGTGAGGEVIALLAEAGTEEARRLAVVLARDPASLPGLVPLLEAGYVPAGRVLVRRLAELAPAHRERVLAASVALEDRELQEAVQALCSGADVGSAVLAADALLARGQARGVVALLSHGNRYARAAGTALALRLTPLAGALRVVPGDGSSLDEIGRLCGTAFDRRDGEAWARYCAWLKDAFRNPDGVRALRSRDQPVRLGNRNVHPVEFADFCLRVLGDERYAGDWPALAPFLLSPFKPGRGIPAERLAEVLDAFERRLGDAALRRAWIDALLVLVCAQHGIEPDPGMLEVAQTRLAHVAGEAAPPGARHKPGVYWPIWAAGH